MSKLYYLEWYPGPSERHSRCFDSEAERREFEARIPTAWIGKRWERTCT